jgi:hypothetical protein
MHNHQEAPIKNSELGSLFSALCGECVTADAALKALKYIGFYPATLTLSQM